MVLSKHEINHIYTPECIKQRLKLPTNLVSLSPPLLLHLQGRQGPKGDAGDQGLAGLPVSPPLSFCGL